MLPPLAQNTSTTPISEPPATTPDATGKMNSSASFGFRLSSTSATRAPRKNKSPKYQWNTQARPNADAEGRYSWYFGSKTGASVSTTPTTPPAKISHSLTGSSEDRPWPSAMATADQVWAAGAGNWSVPSTSASGTRTANVSTLTTVPTKMP